MGKTRYTLWKSYIGNKGDAEILENERLYITKRNAFKRAIDLLSKCFDERDTILVRKITFGKDEYTEWEFVQVDECKES